VGAVRPTYDANGNLTFDGTFTSVGDGWADTTTPHGRLMLTVLGGLAEFRRALIRIRTGEGRMRAKTCGVRFGRKHVLSADQRAIVARGRAEGERVRELAQITGARKSIISRIGPLD
jgi:DNA invertase Pin-like site-specific DNA recombinase